MGSRLDSALESWLNPSEEKKEWWTKGTVDGQVCVRLVLGKCLTDASEARIAVHRKHK